MPKKKQQKPGAVTVPVPGNKPIAKKKKPTITDPLSPPFGTYDPALDANVRASERGLRHLKQDLGTEGTRASEDLYETLSLAGRNKDRSLFDLGQNRQRTHEDLNTRESRGNRDFDTQLQNVFRQFNNLGYNQGQAANQAGVLGGGTLRSGAAKRAANQQLARAPIDTARSDLLADLSTSRSRTEQDYGTDTGRVGEDYTTGVNRANLGFKRGDEDRYTKRQRGISEQGFYEQDIGQQKVYQARANKPGVFDLLGQRKGEDKKGKGKEPEPAKKKKKGKK